MSTRLCSILKICYLLTQKCDNPRKIVDRCYSKNLARCWNARALRRQKILPILEVSHMYSIGERECSTSKGKEK